MKIYLRQLYLFNKAILTAQLNAGIHKKNNLLATSACYNRRHTQILQLLSMKIQTSVQVESYDFIENKKPEHIDVQYQDDGTIKALSWKYDTSDSGLYTRVKRLKGVWNKEVGGWTFEDSSVSQELFQAICKKHPDWIIRNFPEKHSPQFLRGIKISNISLPNGHLACLLPVPLPSFSSVKIPSGVQSVQLAGAGKNQLVGMLVGKADLVTDCIKDLMEQGATVNDALTKRWGLSISNKLKVKVAGWEVQIVCDLANPLHHLISPAPKFKWEGVYPYGTKVRVPWDGIIHTTRKLWTKWKDQIETAGLEWEGDDPTQEIVLPISFQEDIVPGWHSPAANGHMLHEYQKVGVRFCASRGMRALIGDEMGIGKTAQAIASVESIAASKVLVICPANARYVWDREIKGWGRGGLIQHISNQLDTLNTHARWHVATYDQLVSRSETWKLNDALEVKAFLNAFPDRKNDITAGKYPRKVQLSQFSDVSPAFPDPKRVAAWQKLTRRLRGELLEQILAAGPILVILDEAHRAKNRNAKRTQVIQRITAGETQVLLLTGTPLRNNEHEAAVLLSFLDAEAGITLNKQNGYTIEDVKDYLAYYMIRRTKAEVLPELPEKTRQQINLDQLDKDALFQYRDALDSAFQAYQNALQGGLSDAQARQKMQGEIERARTALGLAKIRGGEVADLIADVVENKECCVVFCAHHQVSDELNIQLEKAGIKSAVVDGRTPQLERARIEQDFQAGKLDVFIGGINAAGEAITLTRADTVIFTELDWVPAALMQAEDRIHRIGQKRNCLILQLVAQLDGDNLDEMMIKIIGAKLELIGSVLDEDKNNIFDSAGGIQSELHRLLLKQPVSVAAAMTAEALAVQEGLKVKAVQQATSVDPLITNNLAIAPLAAPPTQLEKRKRGRPKVYIDQPAPSSTERSKRSVQNLKSKGGKRVMLRLTTEGLDALKTIMALMGLTQETETINLVLISKMQELLQKSTTK